MFIKDIKTSQMLDTLKASHRLDAHKYNVKFKKKTQCL
jgi:hypothetical protein